MKSNLTVREACKRRIPLDGADAEALEHAVTMTEKERDKAITERDAARHQLLLADTRGPLASQTEFAGGPYAVPDAWLKQAADYSGLWIFMLVDDARKAKRLEAQVKELQEVLDAAYAGHDACTCTKELPPDIHGPECFIFRRAEALSRPL